MERLTTRNETGTEYYYPHCFTAAGCLGTGSSAQCDECAFEHGICSKLGEYEDMEEQGRLIKLPFMVGDTVYQVIDGCIEPCTVEVIFLVGNRDENGNQQYIMELHYDREDCPFISTEAHFPYHGNKIFPTMEEAENELRRQEDAHEQEKEKPEAE